MLLTCGQAWRRSKCVQCFETKPETETRLWIMQCKRKIHAASTPTRGRVLIDVASTHLVPSTTTPQDSALQSSAKCSSISIAAGEMAELQTREETLIFFLHFNSILLTPRPGMATVTCSDACYLSLSRHFVSSAEQEDLRPHRTCQPLFRDNMLE